ncbi:hypothetical protein, partial [Klebsiella pneumoniae]|uniref:hypothetical protein n=1 Tax=Klebsiella pneumoniae TaxID=573 RepID=UPI0015FA23AA|nr:hypothetical protein [Klebsiella pneumoniae]
YHVKYTGRILKTKREKRIPHKQGNPHKAISRFLPRNLAGWEKEWNDIFKNLKDKNLQPRSLYPAKISFKYDGEIKTFPDKQKLREFIATKPPL